MSDITEQFRACRDAVDCASSILRNEDVKKSETTVKLLKLLRGAVVAASKLNYASGGQQYCSLEEIMADCAKTGGGTEIVTIESERDKLMRGRL